MSLAWGAGERRRKRLDCTAPSSSTSSSIRTEPFVHEVATLCKSSKQQEAYDAWRGQTGEMWQVVERQQGDRGHMHSHFHRNKSYELLYTEPHCPSKLRHRTWGKVTQFV